MGVTGTASVDFAKAKDHVASVIASIAPHDSPERFRGLGVDVIEDYARFTGPRRVEGGGITVEARYTVVATGSSAFIPPIPGLAETPFHTNESIFNDRTLPQHLIVIGGGPIGVEMAQAHCRLGARVTLIEAAPSIMIRDDAALVALLRDRLKADGITLIEGAGVTAVSGTNGAVKVEVEGRGTIEGSHLLVAVGRKPNLDKLNLEAAGARVFELRQGHALDHSIWLTAHLRQAPFRWAWAFGRYRCHSGDINRPRRHHRLWGVTVCRRLVQHQRSVVFDER